MSAGFSQNQRNTGGHRPPLQWMEPFFNGFCNTLLFQEGNTFAWTTSLTCPFE
jgi:hypothetical protein